MAVVQAHAAFRSGFRQPIGVLVNIPRGVTFGKETSVIATRQRGFDGAHFLRGHGTALKPALVQKL